MGRPGMLCRLQAGKILDAHQGFVDTFNWIVDFIDNLKGDAELGSTGGSAVVDRTDTARPVIRINSGGVNVAPNTIVGTSLELETEDTADLHLLHVRGVLKKGTDGKLTVDTSDDTLYQKIPVILLSDVFPVIQGGR